MQVPRSKMLITKLHLGINSMVGATVTVAVGIEEAVNAGKFYIKWYFPLKYQGFIIRIYLR